MITSSNRQSTAPTLRIRPPAWSITRLGQVKFVRDRRTGGSEFGLLLSGSYWVEEHHFHEAWNLFWSNAHLFDSRRKYSVASLSRDPNWNRRTRGERIKMGRCFKYFCVQAILPIVLTNLGKSGPRKYAVLTDFAATPLTR